MADKKKAPAKKFALPDGDAEKGQKLFETQCAVCHSTSTSNDDKNATAPNLGKIFGRTAGENQFTYSNPMKKSKVKWNEENLFKYLKAPAKFISGNKMSFGGIEADQDRADLIHYLKTI